VKNLFKKRIFLDYASITPLSPKVSKEILRVEKDAWGNPSSLHEEGEKAKNVLEDARLRVAKILHSKSEEIFFTTGGTESLNISILGIVKAFRENSGGGAVPHIITSLIEHPAVLNPIKELLNKGEIEASFVAPNEEGIISPESIKRELRPNTLLVAIQHANNEIGTLQPIRKIALILQEYRTIQKSSEPFLLVDASQSFLYTDSSVERLQADILVLDGIKMYGPRGAGVLFVRRGVPISPVTFGGGQQKGIRPGTENVPAASGLAKAMEEAASLREGEAKRLAEMRDYLIQKIQAEIRGAILNGSQKERLPNNVNFCFKGQDSEFLVIKLDTLGFAVSAASACHALSLENSSYVIEALGGEGCGGSSLRFTFGRDTKKSDLDKLLTALKNIVK
jgi:cysteine desulfurase